MNVKVRLRKGEDMEDMSQCKDVLFFYLARGRGCPTAMGCYKDYRGKRVLPKLIMNQRGIDGFLANYTKELPR